jgi:hypothetical protein
MEPTTSRKPLAAETQTPIKPQRRSLLQLLCAAGKHDWQRSTSGMAAHCKRPGCNAYWEYD